MNIFQTAMISQVLFGAGARHSIGQTLTNMGAKKALIVTDKFLHDSGLSNNVEASIKNAGIESVMFDGTEPENPIEVIDVVKILILEEKIDAIIGFGGGSAMDLAKCTRTMTVNERPIQNYYDLRVPRKTNPSRRSIADRSVAICTAPTSSSSHETGSAKFLFTPAFPTFRLNL